MTRFLASIGGQIAFALVKAILRRANARREERALPASFRERLRALLPDLDLERIRYVPRADIRVVNAFKRRVSAITIGYRIYCRRDIDLDRAEDQRLMAHEVFHVEQLRRRNDREDRFARDYGKAYAGGGFCYANNALEKEARRFEDVWRGYHGEPA